MAKIVDRTFEKYISTSRETIRNQMMNRAKEYLGLEINFSQTTYWAYMIDLLSIFSSNQMLYSNLGLLESTIDTAQLPESIYNLAAHLGYSAQRAQPASGTITISFNIDETKGMPAEFHVTFANDMYFYANDIKYQIGIGDVHVRRTNEAGISCYLQKIGDLGGGIINIPYEVVDGSLIFNIEVMQLTGTEKRYTIPNTLSPYQFHRISDNTLNEQINTIEVVVGGEQGVKWTAYSALSLMNPDTEGFVSRVYENEYTVIFGNSVLGKQPEPGTPVDLIIYTTKGEGGNIAASQISRGDRIVVEGGQVLSYEVTNPFAFNNGSSYEIPESIKANAKKSFKAFNRLVSGEDFENVNAIVPEFPFNDSFTILKQSDLKSNEIVLYNVMELDGTPVPSRTETVSPLINLMEETAPDTYSVVSEAPKIITPYSVIKVDDDYYYNPFEMSLNPTVNRIDYRYIIKKQEFTMRALKEITNIYPIWISKVLVETDFDAGEFNLTFSSLKDPEFDISGGVILQVNIVGWSYEINELLAGIPVDDTITNFTLTLPMDYVPEGDLYFNCKLINNSDSTLINEYTTDIKFKVPLRGLIYSEANVIADNPDPLDYTIFDTPLINKEWFDNADDDIKDSFEKLIIAKIAAPEIFVEKRMFNVNPSIKFSNTTGYIKNIFLNQASITVLNKIADYTNIVTPANIGDKYIIKGPCDPTGPWAGKENHIVTINSLDTSFNPVWNESDFEIKSVSSMVYNLADEKSYFFNGRLWKNREDFYNEGKFKLPLEIKVILYTDDGELSIIEEAKDLIMYYYGKHGHEKTLYRSELAAILNTLSSVKNVKIISPEIDLPYIYTLRDFTPESLADYAPEYLYVLRENINIDVRLYEFI